VLRQQQTVHSSVITARFLLKCGDSYKTVDDDDWKIVYFFLLLGLFPVGRPFFLLLIINWDWITRAPKLKLLVIVCRSDRSRNYCVLYFFLKLFLFLSHLIFSCSKKKNRIEEILNFLITIYRKKKSFDILLFFEKQ